MNFPPHLPLSRWQRVRNSLMRIHNLRQTGWGAFDVTNRNQASIGNTFGHWVAINRYVPSLRWGELPHHRVRFGRGDPSGHSISPAALEPAEPWRR